MRSPELDGEMEMLFRAYKWMRYVIVTLFVFNLFQAMVIRVETPDPLLFMLDKNTSISLDGSVEKIDGGIIEKIRFNSRTSADSEDMIERSGILTTRPNSKGTILICHGYMCNKFDVSFLRTFFPDYNCLSFDFRAHGENSVGQICTLGKDEAYDVIGAAEFIKNHPKLKDQPIIGFGFSMGAVSLIQAQANKHFFDAMILDCPFESVDKILSQGMENLRFNLFGYPVGIPGKSLFKRLSLNSYTQPIMKLMFRMFGIDTTKINTRFESFNLVNSIKKIHVPCLFIHCKNDKRIPISSAKKLFANVKGLKRMWLTKGRTHCDSFIFNPERYKKITNNFLTQFFTKKLFHDRNTIIEDN